MAKLRKSRSPSIEQFNSDVEPVIEDFDDAGCLKLEDTSEGDKKAVRLASNLPRFE
jgi:hypothetical protein